MPTILVVTIWITYIVKIDIYHTFICIYTQAPCKILTYINEIIKCNIHFINTYYMFSKSNIYMYIHFLCLCLFRKKWERWWSCLYGSNIYILWARCLKFVCDICHRCIFGVIARIVSPIIQWSINLRQTYLLYLLTIWNTYEFMR